MSLMRTFNIQTIAFRSGFAGSLTVVGWIRAEHAFHTQEAVWAKRPNKAVTKEPAWDWRDPEVCTEATWMVKVGEILGGNHTNYFCLYDLTPPRYTTPLLLLHELETDRLAFTKLLCRNRCGHWQELRGRKQVEENFASSALSHHWFWVVCLSALITGQLSL